MNVVFGADDRPLTHAILAGDGQCCRPRVQLSAAASHRTHQQWDSHVYLEIMTVVESDLHMTMKRKLCIFPTFSSLTISPTFSPYNPHRSILPFQALDYKKSLRSMTKSVSKTSTSAAWPKRLTELS